MKRRLIAMVTGFTVDFSGISVPHANSTSGVASDFGIILQTVSPVRQSAPSELDDHVSIDSTVTKTKS